MEKCACDKHGYCEYYKQEMTYSPPTGSGAEALQRNREKI